MRPCPFGTHRVIDPKGVLPQAAWKVDNTPRVYENEILFDVEALNIDSASFRQIAEICERDPKRIADHIANIVHERGKQHNPVTGSGGICIGHVREVGAALQKKRDLAIGDHIASLVSLSLMPLYIDRIKHVDMTTGRLWIDGTGILFESGWYAKLPSDIPEEVAMPVLDVCGAPAQVRKFAQAGQTIVIIGADGKSGILSCAQAREKLGESGLLIGVVPDRTTAAAELLESEHYVDILLEADARDAVALHDTVISHAPNLADLVVNCVNVTGTEMGSILCTREGGMVYFFSTNTSFTGAMLGADGVSKDVVMVIGDGYAKGGADLALQTLRDHPSLMEYFRRRFENSQPPCHLGPFGSLSHIARFP